MICIPITKCFSFRQFLSKTSQITSRTLLHDITNNVNDITLADIASKPIIYEEIQHCGVIVKNVNESIKFYIDMFDCIDESYRRPITLPYPGAFLRFGRNEIHLMQLPNCDPTEGRPAHGGRDRHIAMNVNNIEIIGARYKKRNLPYTMSMSGRRALFCRDIDGNAYEFMEDPKLNDLTPYLGCICMIP